MKTLRAALLALLCLSSVGCYGFASGLGHGLNDAFFDLARVLAALFGVIAGALAWQQRKHPPGGWGLALSWLLGIVVVGLTAGGTEWFSPWPGTVPSRQFWLWFLPLPAALLPLWASARFVEGRRGKRSLRARGLSLAVAGGYLALLLRAMSVSQAPSIASPFVEISTDRISYGRTSDGRIFTLPYARANPGLFRKLAAPMALDQDGRVAQLSDGYSPLRYLDTGAGARDIASASGLQCVVDHAGRVLCFDLTASEHAAGSGRLGRAPSVVDGLAGIRQIAVTRGTVCGVDEGGRLSCARPAPLDGKPQQRVDAGVRSVALTSNAACILAEDGTVRSLPDGAGVGFPAASEESSATLPLVAGIDRATHLCAGTYHFCARAEAGSVTCWGGNGWGQLGIKPTSAEDSAPLPISLPAKALSVSCADNASCALLDDGRIFCWGAYKLPASVISGTECDQSFFGPPTYCTEAPELARLPLTYVPYRH